MTRDSVRHASDLELQASPPEHPVSLQGACPVQVTLHNPTDLPALINARLAGGQRENLSRELYAELFEDPSLSTPADTYDSDYTREWAAEDDYRVLEPGRSLTTTFDVFEWTLPTRAGTFWVVITYEADEPATTAPGGLAVGRTTSPAFAVEAVP